MKGAPNERVNLRNARFRDDTGPLDPDCPCPACTTVAAGYLHHLVRAHEPLAVTLLTMHNVTTMNRLMAEIRVGIETDTLDDVESAWLAA